MLGGLLAVLFLIQSQTPRGEIHVQLADPSGAAMQVAGKLTSLATGAERSFHTDAQGAAAIKDLPDGQYRLELSKKGFETHSELVDVAGTPVTLNIRMVLAAVASRVDVAAVTPLAGIDLPLDAIPAPVQTATQKDVQQSGALDLADLMNRRLNGVSINEMQSNPFQPDVNFRGYTASPLLGTPQGLSVYLDGVRQNQPFGDVVSWDLIPANAIAEVTLMPGSNPIFGLNTLGGALSVETKNGTGNPGLSGKLTYGSSGRKALQAEYGGSLATGFNWFLSANAFHESGWRVDSPSDVRQGFARLGRRSTKTSFDFTMSYAYNTLTGNGLQDDRLLANNYASVYTIPDTTGNRSPAFHLHLQHSFTSALTFSGSFWYRDIRTEGINGNANTNSFDASLYRLSAADIAALQAAGYSGYATSGANASNTPFPSWRCIAQGLEQADPAAYCNGLTVFSKEVQKNFGASGQLTWVAAPRGQHNQFTAGAAVDRGSVTFTQNTQFGYINPNYTITGIKSWADGTSSDQGMPIDVRVNLYGRTPNASLFATDTLSIAKSWNITLSGRYNRSTIDNTDRLHPGGGPGSLDAADVFQRFNGAVGVTYSPWQYLNAYASYAQGSRAPTSIELGCADPTNPCNLPNALASDPPLKQVVTGTWEAGVRGKLEGVHWAAGAFRAENSNDILFVASPQTGSGYFQNFGKTRREGVQTSIDGRIRRVSGGLDYTFLAATYQSTETVDGSANNSSDTALGGMPGLDGVITIHPGNRIPLIPKQTGKIFADVQVTSKLAFNIGVVAVSSSYARGNENNAYRSDGKYYLGPGVSGGYAVANFSARYNLNRRLQLAAQIDNVLDRRYWTAAQLGKTGFTAQGTFIARPFSAYSDGEYPLQSVTFAAPGAPRRAWVELLLKF